MSGRSRIEALKEMIQEQLGGYEPENGDDLDGFIGGLADLPRTMGSSVRQAADKWRDEHIHGSAIEAVNEFGGTMSSTGDAADDAFETHRQRHGFWLRNH
jgi:hypothetical protein